MSELNAKYRDFVGPRNVLTSLFWICTFAGFHAALSGSVLAEDNDAKAEGCLMDFLINAELAYDRFAVAAECEIFETQSSDVGTQRWFGMRDGSVDKKPNPIEYYDVDARLLVDLSRDGRERSLLTKDRMFYAFGDESQPLREFKRWERDEKTKKTSGMRRLYRTPNLFTLALQPNTAFSTKKDSLRSLSSVIHRLELVESSHDGVSTSGCWFIGAFGFKVTFTKASGFMPTVVEGFYKDPKVEETERFGKRFPIKAFKIETKWERLDKDLYYPVSIANHVYRFSPNGKVGREIDVKAEWNRKSVKRSVLDPANLADEIAPKGKIALLKNQLENKLDARTEAE